MKAYWEWQPLTVECPICYSAIRVGAAQGHANWHFLTDTEPQKLQ
jgi:hypothetical protein